MFPWFTTIASGSNRLASVAPGSPVNALLYCHMLLQQFLSSHIACGRVIGVNISFHRTCIEIEIGFVSLRHRLPCKEITDEHSEGIPDQLE